MDNDELIIRIRFKSGSVSEERGTEEQVVALIDNDETCLVDYIQTLDAKTGEFSMYVHDDDPNWNDQELSRLFGMD